MEVLENGPSAPPRRGRSALVGVLALAAVAAMVLAELRDGDPRPAPTPAPSIEPTTGLFAVGSAGQASRADANTSEITLQITLRNYGGVPVQVRAAPVAQHPGLNRMAVAVMAGDGREPLPTSAAVRAAASQPVSLGARQDARLVVTARAGCGDDPAELTAVVLQVNGEPTRIPLQTGVWFTELARSAC